jgi:hypothetical protein
MLPSPRLPLTAVPWVSTLRWRIGLVALAVLVSTLAGLGAAAPAAAAPGSGVSGRPSASAGSVPVGSASYAAPADAYYVSPSGNDSAAGRAGTPWRTVSKAIAAAPAGATIVLRRGSYTESVTIPRGKKLTLQSYPGEAAWLDGSTVLTGWQTDGAAWRVDGWTYTFDHSPTYTPGAPDGAGNWGFVNPSYPYAAWPEQVFVDGAAQRQVASRGAVTAGTFYVDTGAHRLYVGSNPSGHEVRASVLRIGLTISGAGSVVRGIGVQRYATPVPDKGALRSTAPDVVLENVVVRDNATQGVFVGATNGGVRNTLRHVTVEGNGLLGIEAAYADGLVLDGLRAVGNNTQHFNRAPVSGGVKICSSRGLTVRNGLFSDNDGPGLWFDESSYDATVTGNDLLRNLGHGLSFEISSKALIADNLVAGNGDVGMKLNDASDLTVWNNTVVNNAGRPFWIVQDSRRASTTSLPGHDPRRPNPDPTVTWLLGPVVLENNVIGGPTTATCLLCFQDQALKRTAAQIGITTDGNVLWRTTSASPKWTALWPNGQSNPTVFTTLAAYRSGTGQDAHGAEFTGASVVDAGYRLTPAVAAQEKAIAQPLPASVASRSGGTAGSERLGAWFG